MERIPIAFEFNGTNYSGWINPLDVHWPPRVYHVILNGIFFGTLTLSEEWKLDSDLYSELASFLGNYIELWYQ